MATTPFDSAITRDLFYDAEVGKLFTDSAEVRAMMLVEGTLAKVQGKLGMIPEISAAAIHRAGLEIQIDPGGLSAETGKNAVVVPALVAAFRKAMEAPEHAQYLHWGATSQDIMDTGLVLRLRQVLSIYETRIKALVKTLGSLAEEHATLPMAARTWGQTATVTSFGAVVASWGTPFINHLDRLAVLRPRLLNVSLSGAAGTLSAMGDDGPKIRAALAEALSLNDPARSWHSTRDSLAELAGWLTLVTGSLGKLGEDILLMTQSGVNEVSLSSGGGSSTMPQKSNPVLPSLLVSLAEQTSALNNVMQSATMHRQQRDGAAWMCEWMSLPQMCMATARALSAATELAGILQPNKIEMAAHIDDGTGLIYAEALSFALVPGLSRPDAQAAVKELCQQVRDQREPLRKLASKRWPDVDFGTMFSPIAQLGQAPAEARDFAKSAKAL